MITREKARKILLDEGEDFTEEEMEKILEELEVYASMVVTIISENIDIEDLNNIENEKS